MTQPSQVSPFTRVAAQRTQPLGIPWSQQVQPATAPLQQPPANAVSVAPASNATLLSILVDVSSSMDCRLGDGLTRFGAAIGAMLAVVYQFVRHDPSIQVEVIVFGDNATQIVPSMPAPQAYDALNRIADNIPRSIGTYVAQALSLIRGGDNHRVTIITDGFFMDDPCALVAQLKQAGVVIDVIGIGPDASQLNEPLLRQIASTENGKTNFNLVNSTPQIQKTLLDIGSKTIGM